MSKPNRMSIKGLQEQHAVEMAEKEKEIEKLKVMLEETEKTCGEQVEKEIAAREAVMKELEEKKKGCEVGETGNCTGLRKSALIVQLPLNACRIVNLKKYVNDILYSEIKLMGDETFKASPKILEEAMKWMGVVSELEQIQLSEATKKEIRYLLSQRRGYSMRSVGKKYKGKRHYDTSLIQIDLH